MIERLRARQEWGFFGELRRAAPGLAYTWWALVVLRGLLPAVVSLAFGWLVSAVTRDTSLTGPLVTVGIAFTASLVVQPLHQFVSSILGSRMAAHMYDRLMIACVTPEGVAHLERPELANDLTMARDFDLGMMGPPLELSMDFVAGGLVDLVVGGAAAMLLFGFQWWVPPVLLAAWIATHWLLRESGVWRDRNTDEVRQAQRHADYSYRLAVDASPAKEIRFFGLAGWVTDRFVTTRRQLYDLQYQATRLREKSIVTCLVLVAAANVGVFWLIADHAANGSLTAARAVVFVQAAIGVSSIAFGGLNWALDGASAPVAALARFEAAVTGAGDLQPGAGRPSDGPKEIRFRDVHFAYPGGRAVLDGIDLVVPAGSSVAIVGQNGAGKTTLAKLLCRLYDPTSGAIEVDGTPLTDLDAEAWRTHVTAVFQDFVRFELSLRTNVAPTGAPDDVIRAALVDAGADQLAGRRPGHHLVEGVSGWHRPVGWAVAAHRTGQGVVRGSAGRRRGAAR